MLNGLKFKFINNLKLTFPVIQSMEYTIITKQKKITLPPPIKEKKVKRFGRVEACSSLLYANIIMSVYFNRGWEVWI